MQRQSVQRQRIGPAIRRLRQGRGLTLDALAEQAGISASHLSRLERSQTLPSFTVLAMIAEVLDVGVDEFVRLERDVTLLDEELRHYLDIIGINAAARDELFALSIEARRALVDRLRQLSDATLTPMTTQGAVARAVAGSSLDAACRSLTRLLRRAGMRGSAFSQAFMRLLETPGARTILLTDRSFFMLPPEADLVGAYRAVFRDEALDPCIPSWWERSEWVHDFSVRQRWPLRMVATRSALSGPNGVDRGPAPQIGITQARTILERLKDRLERDAGFELAITDVDLCSFNLLVFGAQYGLIERLPERPARDGAVRAGLWLNAPESVGACLDLFTRVWDSLPAADRNREDALRWLHGQLRELPAE